MPSPAVRAARLEEKARERDLREGARSAPERAWDRALSLAPAEETEELERLCELSETQEPESLPLLRTLLKVWELKERIMRRASPTLAAYYRTKRCMFLRGLELMEEEAKQDHESWFEYPTPRLLPGSSAAEAGRAMAEEIGRLRRRYYGLSTAAVNRQHAVASGMEPVTDLAEASRLVAEVLAAIGEPDGTDRVLRLVGRVQ